MLYICGNTLNNEHVPRRHTSNSYLKLIVTSLPRRSEGSDMRQHPEQWTRPKKTHLEQLPTAYRHHLTPLERGVLTKHLCFLPSSVFHHDFWGVATITVDSTHRRDGSYLGTEGGDRPKQLKRWRQNPQKHKTLKLNSMCQ